MKHRISFVWIVALAASLLPRPAIAAFHLMEIEQVIGGVNGDATAQAVQIRMRSLGQNLLNNARLVVRDAAGANPVTLVSFALPNPTNSAACSRVLTTTTAFNAKTTPTTVPDYTMAAIPASYLAAGSLTFEGVAGSIVYWRVTWGGAGYTGTQPVDLTNFGAASSAPAFSGALPSGGPQALHFTPACGTVGSNTAAQYALTAGAAVFTNNAPTSFTVSVPPIPALPGDAKLLLPAALGLAVLAFAILRRRRA